MKGRRGWLAARLGNWYFGFIMGTARPMTVALDERVEASQEALLVAELQAGSASRAERVSGQGSVAP